MANNRKARYRLETGLENTLEIAIPKSAENLMLPDPYLYGYWLDKDDRTFWIEGEINDNTFEIVKEIIRINKTDAPVAPEDRIPIKIYINSYGGDLSVCYAIIDAIVGSKTKVITLNAALAYSAAALIWMAGHERLAFPHCNALIHEGSASFSGTHSEIEEAQKSYNRMVTDMRDYVLAHTKIDAKMFSKNAKRDWYVTAQESIELGICDKIVSGIDELS